MTKKEIKAALKANNVKGYSSAVVTLNAGNRTKKWYKYCMDSNVLDRAGMAELRMTKDVPEYNSAMYVIVVFNVNDGIEETLSENTYSKEEILRLWQEYKNDIETKPVVINL